MVERAYGPDQAPAATGNADGGWVRLTRLAALLDDADRGPRRGPFAGWPTRRARQAG